MLIEDNIDIYQWFDKQDKLFDVWITDPPYPFDSQNGTNRYKDMYLKFTWNDLKNIFDKMYSMTNDGGRAYVFCNRDGIQNTIDLLQNSGFRFLNLLIWDKLAFGGGYHWRNQAEFIIYVSKNKPKVEVKSVSNIFKYKRPFKKDNHPEINYMPAGKNSAKPYYIWRDILIHGVLSNEYVADPFSGTNPMRAAYLLEQEIFKKDLMIYTNSYDT